MKKIQKLSQEVSIGTDTLRVWERRYGFPNPKRDARGHRVYPPEQVEELKIVKKLQSLGFRPNIIFNLSPSERRELLNKELERMPHTSRTFQKLIAELTPLEISQELQRHLDELGPEPFVYQLVVPLLYALDHGWTDGSINIAREHLISDSLEAILKGLLKTGAPDSTKKRLLFLTLSGERHKLGLLMSAVLFHAEGFECFVLNEEIPLAEVPQLATDLQVTGVALSFSTHYSTRQTKNDLVMLRGLLDQEIKLIAGGDSVRQVVKMPNFFACTELEKIPELCKKQFQ